MNGGPTRPDLVDLAARRLGGMVVAVNDEFFAPADGLLDPEPPVYYAHRFTPRGQWMDGWESRRRRTTGEDWVIVRLGVPGVVREVLVDTRHFRGNQPASCRVEGCVAVASQGEPDLAAVTWHELVTRAPLGPDAEHRLEVAANWVTHVRLVIDPDGGVARLRVLGTPQPDLRSAGAPRTAIDLAALVNGGQVVAASDETFAVPGNVVLPGEAIGMGDGWETRRRRGEGADWLIVRLATAGEVERIDVDTTHYIGNYPEACDVAACLVAGAAAPSVDDPAWRTVVGRTRLAPHARQVFALDAPVEATHVRLSMEPDGGVARLRVWGKPSAAGWREHRLANLNALPLEVLAADLRGCCAATAWVERVAAMRPWRDVGALLAASALAFDGLGEADWREAFAAHPRIGELPAGGGAHERASRSEQAAASTADAAQRAELAQGNREYEERFGHVFLVDASGREPGELLGELRRRLAGDPATELTIAAGQQRRISERRLQALVER